MTGRSRVAAAAIACLALGITVTSQPAGPPSIPEFWSTELLEDYELPLAAPSRTPHPCRAGTTTHCPSAASSRPTRSTNPIASRPATWTGCARPSNAVVFDAATLRTDADWGNFPFDQVFAEDIPNIPSAVMPLVAQALVGASWDVEGTSRLRRMSRAPAAGLGGHSARRHRPPGHQRLRTIVSI